MTSYEKKGVTGNLEWTFSSHYGPWGPRATRFANAVFSPDGSGVDRRWEFAQLVEQLLVPSRWLAGRLLRFLPFAGLCGHVVVAVVIVDFLNVRRRRGLSPGQVRSPTFRPSSSAIPRSARSPRSRNCPRCPTLRLSRSAPAASSRRTPAPLQDVIRRACSHTLAYVSRVNLNPPLTSNSISRIIQS